jgi:preprotein translocase subunit SecA
MLEEIIKKIFGDPDDKKIKKYSIIVEEINKKFGEFSDFTLDDVVSKTKEFQSKFEGFNFKVKEDSIKINEILEEIKVEAFANLKMACTLLNGKSFEI